MENKNKLHKTIEFNSCRYHFIQRLKQNICVYHDGVTIATVKIEPENDDSHRYFVLGLTFINGGYDPGYDGDGVEYQLSGCNSKNQSGYAQPIEFSDY